MLIIIENALAKMNVILVKDVDLKVYKTLMAIVPNIFQQNQMNVIIVFIILILFIVIFAWDEEDMFMCKSGFGILEDFEGTIDMFKFHPGLYRCNKKLKSINAGNKCLTD